jgi:Tol biopolymer transport system component
MVRYSPDNSKIAIMASNPKGPWKIYWVSAEGGSLHELPAPITVQADPAWSSDSQSIMFGLPPELMGGGSPGVLRHIYRYDLRTDKTTEVPGSEGLFSPRSAPNGRYIAAMTADLQGLSLLDTTTSKWRSLTRQQATNTPFWSPDGAWVYFNDIGDTGLWRVRVSDGHVEALGRIPRPSGYNQCWAESFAPDGTALLGCNDSRQDIFALDYKEEK